MVASFELVALRGFRLMVPTRVVCWMTFVGSVPMERVTVILPGVNAGASTIWGKDAGLAGRSYLRLFRILSGHRVFLIILSIRRLFPGLS